MEQEGGPIAWPAGKKITVCKETQKLKNRILSKTVHSSNNKHEHLILENKFLNVTPNNWKKNMVQNTR